MNTLPGSTMTMTMTEADAGPPRPGLANALGIGHILIATMLGLVMVFSLVWAIVLLSMAKAAGGAPSAMMGMDEPRYLVFIMVDAVSSLILDGFTFASGVALVNLRPWGGRVWRWLAPARIVRLVVVWGGFIVAVAPALALNVARSMLQMFQGQATSGRRVPTLDELSLIYAWTFLALGIGMIAFGSIYPAVSWWLARRPGLRAALVKPESGPASTPVATVPIEEARLP